MDFRLGFPDIHDKIEDQTGKLTEALEAVSTLTKRLDELAQKVESQNADNSAAVEAKMSDNAARMDDFGVRLAACENSDLSSMTTKVDDLELKLPQVLAGMDAVRAEMAVHQADIAKGVSEAELARQSAVEAKAAAEAAKARAIVGEEKNKIVAEGFERMQKENTAVREEQLSLKVFVETEHAKVWDEVGRALKRLETSELYELKKQLDSKQETIEENCQTMLGSMLQLLSQAKRVANEKVLAQNKMLSWKREADNVQKKRYALQIVKTLAYRKLRESVSIWKLQNFGARCVRECSAQLASQVPRVDEELSRLGLSERLEEIAVSVDAIAAAKVDASQVEESAAAMTGRVDEIVTQRLEPLEGSLSILAEATSGELAPQLEAHGKSLEDVGSRAARLEQLYTDMAKDLAGAAEKEDVHGMIRDTVLLFSTVKQLDASKVDRSELERLQLETATRHKHELQSTVSGQDQRHDSLEREVAELRLQNSEVLERLEEARGKYKRLEEVCQKMTEYMQELLASGLQPGGASALGSTAVGSRGRTSAAAPVSPGDRGPGSTGSTAGGTGCLGASAAPAVTSAPGGISRTKTRPLSGSSIGTRRTLNDRTNSQLGLAGVRMG